MADLMERIAGAGRRSQPTWTEAEIARGLAGLRRRQRRARTIRLAVASAAACSAGLFTAAMLRRSTPPEAPAVVARESAPAPKPSPGAEPPAGALRLADGSRVTPLGSGAELAVHLDTAARAVVDLERGRSRFEVVPNPARAFEVRAGDVTVSVLGTVFTVERVADRVGVAVERGSVRVDWGAGARQLRAGDRGWFPPLVAARERPRLPLAGPPPRVAPPAGVPPTARPAAGPAAPSRSSALEPPLAPLPAAPPPLPPPPPPSASASESAPETPLAPPRPRPSGGPPAAPIRPPGPDDLLRAADNARLAGQPDEAIALLRRILEQHRHDPRAPIAAFTLGRMFLARAGGAQPAALAFAEARALAPDGALAEDALAREVEAWARAGEHATARARAEEYLRRYGRGRRGDQVRALGGLP